MTKEKMDFSQFSWLNKPEQVEIDRDSLEIVTQPNTDFWQRTYYGFRRNSGHAFLTHLWDDFSFSIQTEFFYESLFDQCGLFLYVDEEHWAKASIEYVDDAFGQLGSVVTSGGFSDWACVPTSTEPNRMFYRISRRGADFRFDFSRNGDDFQQMRIFHMPGDLSMAKVGVYACSPSDSTFKVRFSEFLAAPSAWV